MEKFTPRKAEKIEGTEGFKPVEFTREATLAVGVVAAFLGSAEPAMAQDRAPMDRPAATIKVDLKAIHQMAREIQFIIKSPQTKEIVKQAGEEMAQIGIAAAAEVAKPALESAIEALIKVRQGLDAQTPSSGAEQEMWQDKK
jgi:hypothetical protein